MYRYTVEPRFMVVGIEGPRGSKMLQNKLHNEPKRNGSNSEIKNELGLKANFHVIRDSNGKSHWQLAERYNISRSRVGNILRNKRKYLVAFENNEPTSRKQEVINTAFDETGVICITDFDIDFVWTLTNSNKSLA